MKKRFFQSIVLAVSVCFLGSVKGQAASIVSKDTKITQHIATSGEYSNWEGVSNVSQFLDEKGRYCFAYDNKNTVVVVKTKNGVVQKKVTLKKKHTKFGAVTCDKDGNYYLVTGAVNNGSDTTKKTVFISKYDENGTHIKTIGNNGSSSLADYYDSSFYTKEPFSGGNCDVAVNGNYLAVNYARTMYSDHQSNSVWVVTCDTMKTVSPVENYNSHSFGQRAISFGDGFLFMSEGDCYPRAFSLNYMDLKKNVSNEADIFHFWVKKGTLDKWDMYTLNDNFAHIGDMCDLKNGTASFVATSVKALDSNAKKQKEQIFIQIFDPMKKLTESSGYITTGKRSGKGGPNGNEKVTDYGVKWLTSYSDQEISYPQAVSDDKGNTIILYELEKKGKYLGVYSMVVDASGNVTAKSACCSKKAHLNPCETPVYAEGKVWWTGNMEGNTKKMYVFGL